jgi:hypothetical protein
MHLFAERTVFIPNAQVDEIALPPIHVIFALKKKNAKKLDSHAWSFEAFAEHMKPKYCILIDVGRLPVDRDPKIARVCGELTRCRPNFCQVTVSNILDRLTVSVFGFIDVLPGAFSAYWYKVVKTKECTLTSPMNQLGAFPGNMHLAEDRILWTMHYCKGAVAKTGVPETVEGLIRQRRRWLNGTFFAVVYTVMRFPRVVNDTVHSAFRKFFFFCEFAFIATVLTVTWMFRSSLYLTCYFIWKGGFRNTFGDSGDEKGGEDTLLFMSLIYLSFLMVQFVYRVSVFYFSALTAFTTILSQIPWFSLEIWLTRDENYCDEAKEDVVEEVEGAEKRGVPSASIVSAKDYGLSETFLMGGGCTGSSVSISKANKVSESSESWDMVPSPMRTGVVANVPRRRDGSVGPIINVKGLGVMNALIEHLMHIMSAFVVLLGISIFTIGYAMGANVILIGLMLTAKRKRMLATNRKGVRRHGVTMTMFLLAVITLPGIDAGVIDLTTTTSAYGRVLNTNTMLTDSNIKTAAQLWVSDQASATSTYGLVHTWDLSEVTNMEQSKSIRISENDLT